MRLHWALGCVVLSGCARAEPPAGSVDPPEPVTAAPLKSSAQAKQPVVAKSAAPAASSAPIAALDPGPPQVPVPNLLDDAGVPLPQTEDRPRTDSPWFRTRAEKLWQSIVKDDPESSLEFFFPLVAYQSVKDVGDPARDYKYRLIKNFKRDVHEYHGLLGDEPEKARFVGIEVPEDQAKWMKPHTEGNKLGYFRVLRSRLRFADAKGKERELEVTSFISWRGEWYLVHLHGFK
jgi:hypothetical protein